MSKGLVSSEAMEAAAAPTTMVLPKDKSETP
eukprot:CAMPEP_0174380046 /NCGR_PEP_ID=MMETSP0811_2-20130205/123117_1 /TAXON_ID=73025 ORGANISM="Eutreptiella gymnastica-like, Strain CCMP1594" /NCGR_SAMPLE_ID=MMETSP0811_2 /ASSEMBLY_ACC=CAM_ASM_000667 /LENGTH=30 /DNA_ID= /DNA_START= /DNA_END= /DNA_ORIENTATION=